MANLTEFIVVTGAKRTIEYAVRNDGSIPAYEFVKGLLKKSEHAERDILARFAHIAANSEIGAPEGIFKKERGEFSTFKYTCEQEFVRLPCFRYGNSWIVTHGFTKIK